VTVVQENQDKIHVFGVDGSLRKFWKNAINRCINWHSTNHLALVVCGPDWSKSIEWNDFGNFLDSSEDLNVLVVISEEIPEDVAQPEFGDDISLFLKALNLDRDENKADTPILWSCGSNLHKILGNHKEMARIPRIEKKHDKTLSLGRLANALSNETVKKAGSGKYGICTFVKDPQAYRVKMLHHDEYTPGTEERILCFEEQASRIFIPPELPLKVLLVENNWDDLQDKAKDIFKYLKRAEYYLISEKFEELPSFLSRYRQGQRGNGESIKAKQLLIKNNSPEQKEEMKIEEIPINLALKDLTSIDLVLQDIMLGGDVSKLTGLHLAPYYLQASPQALVFLLTGMDVEVLATSGDVDWQYVDGIIPKKKISSLWFHYYKRFQEVFGRFFWPAFVNAEEGDGITNRGGLRKVFGTLRRWYKEPSILTYGQGVPELIDHAERHTKELWRLVDSVIGVLSENSAPRNGYLTTEDRVELALAVWLHDMGHRGDEYCSDSILIRDNHAAISEYLLLRNPDAYGLKWLRDLCNGKCSKECEDGVKARLAHRNHPRCDSQGEICALRRVGLLCRHHQSSAPLRRQALAEIQENGKNLSPYARVSISTIPQDSEIDRKQWMDPDIPLAGWIGSDVVCLDNFLDAEKKRTFVALAGLLRFLDGLQLHRNRVGSPVCISSFEEFLKIRDEWARRQIKLADRSLRESPAGTRTYQETLSSRFRMDPYLRLLRVQYIHYWRQVCVHDVQVSWSWRLPGRGSVDINFLLDDWGLESIRQWTEIEGEIQGKKQQFNLLEELQEKVNSVLRDKEKEKWGYARIYKDIMNQYGLKNSQQECLPSLWAVHVLDDMITGEHDSQSFGEGGEKKPVYGECLPDGVSVRVMIKGTVSREFNEPVLIYEFPNARI